MVSGHRGSNNDPGAVCEDGSGLTEAAVNYSVAERVVRAMRARQYEVDLLEEFDDRLNGYRAAVVLSIHADSCAYVNDIATGYKVVTAASRENTAADQRLVQCFIDHYGAATGLGLHPSITEDMTHYHTFGEISPHTPAAIIEIGFLYLDRRLLTQQPDLVAQGIIDGLMCYLESPEPTPTPLPFYTPPPETATPQ
ncbi:MAG: N-acetylmuramoyl-L-alanine amidase [Anaerolineae bacterium]|nr:N-acetylmuramoyl-L-alanine amidase [Anaerolineae bacterium]